MGGSDFYPGEEPKSDTNTPAFSFLFSLDFPIAFLSFFSPFPKKN